MAIPTRRALAHGRPSVRPAVLSYAAIASALWLVVAVVHLRLGPLEGSFARGLVDADRFWHGWVRFDAGWYLRIVVEGYSYTPGQQSTVAFFPTYPVVVGGLYRVLGDVVVAGILVSLMSGLGAAVLFWRWSLRHLPTPAAMTGLLLLLLFPYAWFLYGTPYGDSLFLLSALAAFQLAEADRPVLAGLVGIAATAGRPVGVAVTLGLLVLVMERRGALEAIGARDLRGAIARMRRADLGVLLSLAGLGAWCGYLWVVHGNPFLFSEVQEWWGQPSSPSTWLKLDFFRALGGAEERGYANGLVLQALCALGAIATVPMVRRRLGTAYAVYVVAVLAPPLVGSQDFHGLGRYVLAAFPAFAVVGERVAKRPELRRPVMVGCSAMLVVLTAGYARGYYLA